MAPGFLIYLWKTKIQRFEDSVRHSEDGKTWIDLPADSVVSMNMWGFTPSLFEELDAGFVEFLKDHVSDPKAEYFLPERVGNLVAAGRARVNVLRTDERWFGITYKEDSSWKRRFTTLSSKGSIPHPYGTAEG